MDNRGGEVPGYSDISKSPVNYSPQSLQRSRKFYLFNHSHKECTCLCVALSLSLVLAVVFLGGGSYTLNKYQYGAPENSYRRLGHRNDTILLKDNIDSFWTEGVTVSQCVDSGDDYHEASVFVIKSEEVVLERVDTVKRSPRYDQDSSSFKAGIIDYRYLLSGSYYIYSICMASTTSKEQSATYFLFDNLIDYRNYMEDVDNGETYAIFSKPIVAGRNNQSLCYEIVYNISQPSYYFMMVRSPGKIFYSYNFTLHAVMYNTTNATQYCTLGDLSDCMIYLESEEFKHVNYDIITFIQPDSYEQSILTHFCLSTLAGSPTLQRISYISWSLLAVSAFLLVAASVSFICIILFRVHKNVNVGERQRLLDKY